MALRATWKGSLKLSLITIPIRAFSATTDTADVSFHQVHRVCKTRIKLKKWCPTCDREVERDEIVKGHERKDGDFVLVEEDDIKAVRPESTRIAHISHVVSASSIDPVLVERSYFLAPDTKAAGPSFAVIRDALDDQAAIGRLAIHGREYLVAVMRRDDALVLYTLRTSGEVRKSTAIKELDFADVKSPAPEVRLARQVLASFDSGADIESFTDNYQKALKAMLAKKKGTEVATDETEADKPAKVVNLMDALRKSLDAASSRRSGGRKVQHKSRTRATGRAHKQVATTRARKRA
ncbi:MAG: Ku protein [Acidobacteria bacterium]|nr:Ku protein [Acidobacteriota bacterium]